MLVKHWVLASCVRCVTIQIISRFCFIFAAFWSLKTAQMARGWNCHKCRSSAVELLPPHLRSNWSEYYEDVRHVALWMGERETGRVWGGGREGRARERDCSVVVYVSLRSCVGRSAPSRHCCCCEKERTKDSPCCGPLIPLPAQLCHDHTLMECSWN